MSGDRGKGQSTHCCFRCERKHRRTHPKAIAVRTRAQASPSRPIAQIRSGIVRGSLRLPTQIVEEPGAGVSWLVTPRLHAKVGVGLAQAALLFTPASESQATPPAPTIKEGRAARTGSIALLATSVLQLAASVVGTGCPPISGRCRSPGETRYRQLRSPEFDSSGCV